MVLRVHLKGGAVVRGYVCDGVDALRMLRELTRAGKVCEKWVVEERG